MPCGNCNCPFYELQAENSPLSAAEIQCMISEAVQKVKFRKGQVLFLQGQSSASLYSLASGMVKICSHTSEGRQQIVGLSSSGNLLVGLQSINDERYAYSAAAATAVNACKINHRVLLEQVQHRGDLAMRLIDAVNAKLAHTRALVQVMGHKNAAAKIASFILLMTPKSQHGNCRFTLPFSRMDIASLLGLSEETVCRLMANMKRTGVIYAPRGNIEIRDWEHLQAIADGAAREHPAA
jgi:CRP/FNR family transcriptional regulator